MLTLQIRNLGNMELMSCLGQGSLRSVSVIVVTVIMLITKELLIKNCFLIDVSSQLLC